MRSRFLSSLSPPLPPDDLPAGEAVGDEHVVGEVSDEHAVGGVDDQHIVGDVGEQVLSEVNDVHVVVGEVLAEAGKCEAAKAGDISLSSKGQARENNLSRV